MDTTASQSQSHSQVKRKPLFRLLRLYFTLAVPILLTLISVRIVMTPLYIELEYTRAGFPEDIYGFTTEQRLEYGQYTLDYLLNGEDISYLGELTFPNGDILYTSSELRHMEDVKVITRIAYFILFGLGISTITLVILSLRTRSYVAHLRMGLFNGGLLTLGIISSIIIVALVAWDTFFTTFHQIFFESGTWRFAYSDTLIRLFPEQFWFDAAIVIGGLTALGALIITFAMWQWGRKAS